MRKEFTESLLELAKSREDLVLISGDLGFMAFEQVREILGKRFINAGVAEQNMISVAAGLAARGFIPVVYSIAPFATLRPLEQIRNDLCLHNLPVTIVGNGGGYGYGIMGSSHHALEDVGVMRALPNMQVYIPAFSSDVAKCLNAALDRNRPSYIRLGRSIDIYGEVDTKATWTSFRRVTKGSKAVVLAMGPVVENVISALTDFPSNTVELWTINELPIAHLNDEFKNSVMRTNKLITVEEHYQSSGMSENIVRLLLGIPNLQFKSLCASGYPSGLYGSQKWHQQESGLGEAEIRLAIRESILS